MRERTLREDVQSKRLRVYRSARRRIGEPSDRCAEGSSQRLTDGARDLVADESEVGLFAIVLVGPDDSTVADVDQTGEHSQSAIDFAEGSHDEEVRSERTTGLLRIDLSS